MSDLVGNHIVGFPTRRLICKGKTPVLSVILTTEILKIFITD